MVMHQLLFMMIGNFLLLGSTPMPDTFDGPLSVIAVFIISAISGFAGTIIGLSTFGSDSAKELGRQAVSNFLLAVTMSPTTCYVATLFSDKITMNLFLVVPIAAIWGIGGGLFLKKNGPKIMDRISNKFQKSVDSALGDDTQPSGEGDTTKK